MISKEKRNNTKTLLKAYTTQRRILYDRIAKVGDAIYYDLNSATGQCIRITNENWDIVDNPLLFRSCISSDRELLPYRNYDNSRHYIREIIDKSTIKHQHQRLIDEIYIISLFIPDIAPQWQFL